MNRFVASIIVAASVAASASSETVLVRSGQSEGQGWAFRTGETCWVASPKHVISADSLMVSGKDGLEAQGHSIRRHPDLDLALAKLTGAFAEACPVHAAPLGDRDTAPVLQRLINEGRVISLERRTGTAGDGNGFGLEILSVQVDALRGAEPLFSARLARPDDEIYRSDSGSPIRLRGTGIGEAGLPLGLLQATETFNGVQYLTVLRMDAVRDFFEADAPQTAQIAPQNEAAALTVEAFTGKTPDTSCGPLNAVDANAPCGWRAEREAGGERIGLILNMDNAQSISLVEMRFGEASTLDGFSVATAVNGGDFGIDRYCAVALSEAAAACSLGVRKADRLKIVVEGDRAEILGVEVR